MICDLRFGRIAKVREPPFCSHLRDPVNRVYPFRHLALVHGLKKVMPPVFGVELERERSLVIYKLDNTCIDEAENEGRFPTGSEIEFRSGSLQAQRLDTVRYKCAGDGSHEVKQGRHALLVPVGLLRRGPGRLASAHRLVDHVFPLLVPTLLVELFLLKSNTQIPVAPILLSLQGDYSLERPNKFACCSGRRGSSLRTFALCFLLDATMIELQQKHFFLDVI